MQYRRVLMIVYPFPPLAGAGSIRYLHFAKNLPKFGWKPVILSIRNPSKFISRDYTLKVPKNLESYRSISLPFFVLEKITSHLIGVKNTNTFFFPDRYIGWILDSIRKGLMIIRKKKIELIFVGCPPHSAAIIGYILKKITKKPLVLDYRDPNVKNAGREYASRFHKLLDTKLEQKFLYTADRGIVVTESLKKLFPYPEKLEFIPNGYVDLNRNEIKASQKFEKFTITTLGNLVSADIWINFLKALKEFHKHLKGISIQAIFIGYSHEKILGNIVKRLNLKDVIKFKGFLSNEESTQIIKKSHILIVRAPSRFNMALAVKIFTFLHSDSPTLGILDESNETAKFIKKSNMGIIVKDDVQEILKGLIKLSKGKNFERNWNFIQKYDRGYLTEKLTMVFDEILAENDYKEEKS